MSDARPITIPPVPPAPARAAGGRNLVLWIVACASLALSLVSCAVTGFVVSISDFDPLPVQSKPKVASASELEATAHVTLPPGTVLLSAVTTSGLEDHVAAKFRMASTDQDRFMADAKFSAELTPGRRTIDKSHNIGGGNLWDPQRPKTVSGLVEQQPTPDGTYRTLMLDLDATDVVVAYLYASKN